MPFTKKGRVIMSAMREKYGDKAESVFYASRNSGKISGVDRKRKKKSGDSEALAQIFRK